MNNAIAEELRDARGCGRHRCHRCGQELIHRDHRKAYESASALGHIVGREGPVNISVTNLDLVSRKGLRNGCELVHIIEHKQPGTTLQGGQARTLRLLDGCLTHCASCPAAADLHLDPRSGVVLISGRIASDPKADGDPDFDGPQVIEHLLSRNTTTGTSHEEFFCFLDPEDARRRRGIGWK